MPDINPTAGDPIEITVGPEKMTAKIMTRDNSGKWQVEIAGDPIMRGLVQIENYQWPQEDKQWTRKAEAEQLKVPSLKPKSIVGTDYEIAIERKLSLDF